MNRRNILIITGVVLLAGAALAANLWFQRTPTLTITTETVKARDLEAIVSASGNGLKVGDQVITGPYNSVRTMADGAAVKVDPKQRQRR